jgi:hypothetical protein
MDVYEMHGEWRSKQQIDLNYAIAVKEGGEGTTAQFLFSNVCQQLRSGA